MLFYPLKELLKERKLRYKIILSSLLLHGTIFLIIFCVSKIKNHSNIINVNIGSISKDVQVSFGNTQGIFKTNVSKSPSINSNQLNTVTKKPSISACNAYKINNKKITLKKTETLTQKSKAKSKVNNKIGNITEQKNTPSAEALAKTANTIRDKQKKQKIDNKIDNIKTVKKEIIKKIKETESIKPAKEEKTTKPDKIEPINQIEQKEQKQSEDLELYKIDMQNKEFGSFTKNSDIKTEPQPQSIILSNIDDIQLCNEIKRNLIIPAGFILDQPIKVAAEIDDNGNIKNISDRQSEPLALYMAIKKGLIKSKYPPNKWGTKLEIVIQ